MLPFLKWPGGERWFVANYGHLFPDTPGSYIEPFLGAGSVFFHLGPKRAILGDSNEDLVAVYQGLREDCHAVEVALTEHELNHCETYYYYVRESRPRSSAGKAARFIYLNRTCFNGIYRVNLDGKFNVPKGTRDTIIFDEDDFEGISFLLQNATICASDSKSSLMAQNKVTLYLPTLPIRFATIRTRLLSTTRSSSPGKTKSGWRTRCNGHVIEAHGSLSPTQITTQSNSCTSSETSRL